MTRTLLVPKKIPGWLVVSRGSDGDSDPLAKDIESGQSQIKALSIQRKAPDDAPFDFNTEGTLLGWGLRNSVGVGEEPVTGGIFLVENSVDEVERDDGIRATSNPGEELNFRGTINGSPDEQGRNYKHPECLAHWDPGPPEAGALSVGSQFSNDDDATDEDCARDRVPPVLTFESHTAPLDIKFSNNGERAFVSFHGGRYAPFSNPSALNSSNWFSFNRIDNL